MHLPRALHKVFDIERRLLADYLLSARYHFTLDISAGKNNTSLFLNNYDQENNTEGK